MSKRKFSRALVASVATAALFLSACGGESSNGEAAQEVQNKDSIAPSDIKETPRDQIQDGGELTSAIGELSEQQNPFHADGTAYTNQVWYWYNPQIALFDGEGHYQPNPSYVENVVDEEIDGNTVVTFDLVEEAKFNDGTDIDWTAFETTWKINSSQGEAYTPSSTDGYERISSVEQGDSAKQVKVTFDGTYPWWEGLFNMVAHPALAEPDNYNDYVAKLHPEWGRARTP